MSRKMHADELLIDERLAKQLIASQFPKWSNCDLELVRSCGTDNIMFRLGDDKVVRLPRTPSAAESLQKEIFSVARLANHARLTIPQVIGEGVPGEYYPFVWTINTWLEGERGKSLMTRKESTKKSIQLLDDIYDTQVLHSIWEKSISQPEWIKDPVWIHGDLHPGNILVRDEKISGIIDFGLSGIGDPACDMMVAWTFLDKKGREKFRTIVQADDATWIRGRGWAFTMGVVAYPYYKETNPEFAEIAKRAIDEVVADYRGL